MRPANFGLDVVFDFVSQQQIDMTRKRNSSNEPLIGQKSSTWLLSRKPRSQLKLFSLFWLKMSENSKQAA